MRKLAFVRAVRAAAVLTALGAATPCVAQDPAAARAPAAEIAEFARLALAIAQARDSAQRQLAMPRNKTPQAQQLLREQLAAEIAELKRRAGISEEEYQRRTYLVSTDSASRAAYDRTIATLTGAPIPGQIPAAAAALPVPPGAAGVHVGHVANAFADTPRGQGLLPTAIAEARTAAVHAQLALRAPEDLASIKMHAGHVAHAVDPTSVTAGPGAGYGVKRAALGVATHLDLAARAPGAPPNLATHAAHVGTAARNTVQRADEIVALARRIRAATSAADAAALASQLASLTNELVAGRDADADGRVGWKEGEGGLQQCEEHLKLMVAAPSASAGDR